MDWISALSEFFKCNKLTLNAAKTKLMIVGSKTRLRNLQEMPVYIDGMEIELVNVFKYLGVHLNSKLNFEAHINHLYRKSTNKLVVLRKTREHVDQLTELMLYKSLVLLHLDYCDTFFMTANITLLNKLQLHLCFQLHENIYVDGTSSLSKYFVPIVRATGQRTRGGVGKCMVVEKLKTDTGRKAISYQGPNFWNSLPWELRQLENVDEFKKAVSTQIHDLFGDHPT